MSINKNNCNCINAISKKNVYQNDEIITEKLIITNNTNKTISVIDESAGSENYLDGCNNNIYLATYLPQFQPISSIVILRDSHVDNKCTDYKKDDCDCEYINFRNELGNSVDIYDSYLNGSNSFIINNNMTLSVLNNPDFKNNKENCCNRIQTIIIKRGTGPGAVVCYLYDTPLPRPPLPSSISFAATCPAGSGKTYSVTGTINELNSSRPLISITGGVDGDGSYTITPSQTRLDPDPDAIGSFIGVILYKKTPGRNIFYQSLIYLKTRFGGQLQLDEWLKPR